MITVEYSDLDLAFDFVNSGPPLENRAYIALDSGQIYWISGLGDNEEEVPEDVETSDRYVAVPHKNDLDLGRRLVTRFVRRALPERVEQVEAIFRRRSAYARFKDLLDKTGQLEQWYRFQDEAREQALRAWCAENEIELSAKPGSKPAREPPMKPAVRAVAAADAAAICAIYNPYIAETVISFEQSPVSEAEMARRIRDTTAHYPWLVAEIEGNVVAYAYASRWRTRAAYDWALESTVYVDKAYTGRGIAKPLYLELLRLLQAQGIHAVIGCIALPNDASVALHEKCGFVKVAHFPQVGRKFERWVDVGFWQATFD